MAKMEIKNLQSYKTLYSKYKSSAKQSGKKFDIDLNYFITTVKTPCVYCNYFPKKYRLINAKYKIKCNGLDRINSNKGYTKANTVACCRLCNMSKNNLSKTRWKNWIKRAYNKLWGKK